MNNDKLLGLLEDQRVLLDAYAASSAYVMRKAFAASKELQAFKDRTDLAPTILEKVGRLTKRPGDPVVLSAHLYVLVLTGAEREILAATLQVLREKVLRDNPLAGQFAAQIGAKVVSLEKTVQESHFEPDELEKVFHALELKEGKK